MYQVISVRVLTHSAVDNLPLPRWLNEGLAQQMEDLVRPAHRPFLLTPREVRVQQRYWKWFGIQRFWIGSSFYVKGGHLALSLLLYPLHACAPAMVGPDARVDCEPGQVRKEAAISMFSPVPSVARPWAGRIAK